MFPMPCTDADSGPAYEAEWALAQRPGVRGGIDLAQGVRRDQGVDLRGGHGGMAQQLLHHADIRPALEQVRGKGVPQGMRRSEERTMKWKRCWRTKWRSSRTAIW